MLPRTLLVSASLVVASGFPCCANLGGDDAPPGSEAAVEPAGEHRFVVSATTLKLRATPDRTAAELAAIPRGAEVIVTGPSQGFEEASGIKGGWSPVWYSGRSGYVFDGFLLRFPPPPEGCTSLSAWAATIGLDGAEVVESVSDCKSMGIEDGDTCDRTTRQPLKGGAALLVNTGYEWGSETLYLPGVTRESLWAAGRSCFGAGPDLRALELPRVSGPVPGAKVKDSEEGLTAVVEGPKAGWEYSLGCFDYVHVVQVSGGAQLVAGGGC